MSLPYDFIIIVHIYLSPRVNAMKAVGKFYYNALYLTLVHLILRSITMRL